MVSGSLSAGANNDEDRKYMNRNEIISIALYFVIIVPLTLYFLITTWPMSGTGVDTGEVTYFFGLLTLTLPMEARILVLVILAGALGACLHLGRSFTYFLGRKNLKKDFWYWYMLRPFKGATLAVIFYLAFRGILFTAIPSDFNLYGIIAVACLVGMFSKQATGKLKKVFDELFVKVEDIEKEKADVEKLRQIFEVLLVMLGGMEEAKKVDRKKLQKVFLTLSTVVFEQDDRAKKEKLPELFDLLFKKFIEVESEKEVDVKKLSKRIKSLIAMLTVIEKDGKVEFDLLKKLIEDEEPKVVKKKKTSGGT